MEEGSVFDGYLLVEYDQGKLEKRPSNLRMAVVGKNDEIQNEDGNSSSLMKTVIGVSMALIVPGGLIQRLLISPSDLIISQIISKTAQRMEATGYIPKRTVKKAKGYAAGSIPPPSLPANTHKTEEMFTAINRAIPFRIAHFECPTCQSTSYKHYLRELCAMPNGNFEFKIELECQKCKKKLWFQETLKSILGALGIEITVPGGITVKVGK